MENNDKNLDKRIFELTKKVFGEDLKGLERKIYNNSPYDENFWKLFREGFREGMAKWDKNK